jgi:hypothetical protein
MSELDTVVAVYGTQIEAEEAIKALQGAGIDTRTLSIIGKDSTLMNTWSATTISATVCGTGARPALLGTPSGDCWSGQPSLPLRVSARYWQQDRWWRASWGSWKAPSELGA